MYEYAGNPLYNPAINPYFGMQQPYQNRPRQEVVKVNGENGARAFPMSANSSALLLDESGTIVWLVTTDGAGYKTVSPFDIIPHEQEQQPDYTDLESRIKKLEEALINGTTTNIAAVEPERNYTAYSANPADDRHDKKRS